MCENRVHDLWTYAVGFLKPIYSVYEYIRLLWLWVTRVVSEFHSRSRSRGSVVQVIVQFQWKFRRRLRPVNIRRQSVSVCRLCVGANFIIPWNVYIQKLFIFFGLASLSMAPAKSNSTNKTKTAPHSFASSDATEWRACVLSYKIKRGHQCRRCVYCFNCCLHAFAHEIGGAALPWRLTNIFIIFFSFVGRFRHQESVIAVCFAALLPSSLLPWDFTSPFILSSSFQANAVAFERVLFLIRTKKTIVRDWVCTRKKTNKYKPASNGKTLKNFIAKSTTITTIVFAVVVYGSEWMENPLLAAGLMAFVE